MTVVRWHRLIPALAILVASSAVAADQDVTVPIEEKSILDDGGNIVTDYMRYGGAAIFGGIGTEKANARVKYPDFQSETPIYGQVLFRASGVAPAKSKVVVFAMDRDDAKGDAYSVLYIDVNGDQDLTNDGKVAISKNPPTGITRTYGVGGATSVFDVVKLTTTDDAATPEAFLPWLTMQRTAATPFGSQTRKVVQRPYLMLMSTVVRKGTAQMGDRSYEVLLGRQSQGRSARVMLRPIGEASPTPWKSIYLNRMQQEGDKYFTMTVDDAGETLTISPYRGAFGELKIQQEDDSPEQLGFSGRLYRKDGSTFMVGDNYSEELLLQYRVPVGDYRGYFLVNYGNARASLGSRGYDLQIRDEAPFVFEFLGKPDVTFTAPKSEQVFRPGSRIVFKAMMQDSESGLQLRGLYDTNKKTMRKRSVRNADGTVTSTDYPVYGTLVPTVAITNAAGKEVASGKMPFG